MWVGLRTCLCKITKSQNEEERGDLLLDKKEDQQISGRLKKCMGYLMREYQKSVL